jgi:hypothetical protein
MYVCIGHYQHLHLAHHHPSSLRVWVQWILGQVLGDVLGGLDLEVVDLVTFRGLQNSCPLLNEMHASSSGCVTVVRPTLQPGSPADLCRVSRGNSSHICELDELFGNCRAEKHTVWYIVQWIEIWNLWVLVYVYIYTTKLSNLFGVWSKVTKKTGT